MRPVSDRRKISRAKLAYLIDATAVPICIIAPISSWAAAVSSYVPEDVNGFAMFINTIPFNLYALTTILMMFLPAIIFIISVFLAFATGTSWDTFGILIPIVCSVFSGTEQYSMLIISIAACLSGAVCGDHCSPISDTTIMASAGAQWDHVNHVSTQLPYAITAALVSGVGYIILGAIGYNFSLSLAYVATPITLLIMVITMIAIKKVTSNK